jgi:hypothetical protein
VIVVELFEFARYLLDNELIDLLDTSRLLLDDFGLEGFEGLIQLLLLNNGCGLRFVRALTLFRSCSLTNFLVTVRCSRSLSL